MKRRPVLRISAPGQQARFAQNLEAVADAQHQAAGAREALDGAHHRRKSRDGAGAQIIAVGKSARAE